MVGCGGGDDFSAPPPGLAAQRQKSGKDGKPGPPVTKKVDRETASAAGETENTDAAAEPTTPTTLQMIAAEGGSPSAESPSVEPSVDSTTKAEGPTGPVGSLPPDKPSAITADDSSQGTATGGDMAVSPEVNVPAPSVTQPKTDSKTEVAVSESGEPGNEADTEKGNGGISFLDALKTEPKKNGPAGRNTRAGGDRTTVERTGRLAVTPRIWMQLKLAMSKQFFVAATEDATRLAGSTGERSLSILSTRVQQRVLGGGPQLTGRAALLAQRQAAAQEDELNIGALPAVVNSIELIQSGNLILIGTEDGRLIARSAADLLNWDVYARDLFAFQDEHRPATRVSESGIVAIRRISAERLLTVDGENVCHIWRMNDVVHEPVPPLEMTKEQVISPEVDLLSANPLATVKLSDAQVLTISLSASRMTCAIVTADEIVTIFNTQDGKILASLGAEDLDDTQPVVVGFEEARKQILVGLADGRLMRRSLPGGPAVSSTDQDGIEVDYDLLFAPARNDRSGAVTAMAISPDGAILHFGRYDGNVHKYDLPRRQLVSTRKSHSRAVTDIRITPNGVLSLGDDRVAHITEMPLPQAIAVLPTASAAQRTTSPKTVEKFTLPRDPSLPLQVVDTQEEDKEKSTRPRNPSARTAATDQTPAAALGIRPADPELALLQHQLRVTTGESAQPIREQILQRGTSPPDTVEKVSTEESPVRIGEVPTLIDFSARVVKPVVMSVSNDGKTVSYVGPGQLQARGRRAGNSVIAIDVLTQTTLRTWYGIDSEVTGLDASWENSVVLPRPLEARLQLLSGKQDSGNQLTQYGRYVWSYDRKNILAERLGYTGQALDTFSLQTPQGEILRDGVESFEGAVGAMCYSADGSSIFVSIREKSRLRLLELDAQTLEIAADLSNEPMTGQWNVERLSTSVAIGPVIILPSPNGRLLVTYGKHSQGYQLRIWKRSGTKWPQDQVTVINSSTPLLAANVEDAITFVNRKDNLLAVIGKEGIGTVDSRTGDVKDSLPIPDVNGRRPVIRFTRDGKYALSGDSEGNVWVSELRGLDRRPKKFVAQAGEITGMVLSPDGSKLATAGRENRIRVWDLETYLYGDRKTAGR